MSLKQLPCYFLSFTCIFVFVGVSHITVCIGVRGQFVGVISLTMWIPRLEFR